MAVLQASLLVVVLWSGLFGLQRYKWGAGQGRVGGENKGRGRTDSGPLGPGYLEWRVLEGSRPGGGKWGDKVWSMGLVVKQFQLKTIIDYKHVF